MKLSEAVNIGRGVGLTTIEECVNNIYHFSPSLFPYTKINDELTELYKEYDDYKDNPDTWMEALCGIKG